MSTQTMSPTTMDTNTVEELVAAAQSGNRYAFSELVRRFEGAVYARALRRLHNPFEAEDLSQEVFIRAMNKMDQLKTTAAFGGWLRTITNRLAINRLLRHPRATVVPPEFLETNCSDQESPLEDVLRDEQREQIRAGLARLGNIDRDTLVAFYVDGQSLAEMSRDFESPVGTIKRRLHVARKRLAKELAGVADE